MKEVRVFNTNRFSDRRGFFVESCPGFIKQSINVDFQQDNLSFSKKGVIRGLHYQWKSPMGKLVSVISGSIVDYVVDIRSGSLSYGKCTSFKLSGTDDRLLWVPAGFAHGFQALEDSYVQYKCSCLYDGSHEGSINIFDKDINVPLVDLDIEFIISKRDQQAISFKDYCDDPKFFKEKL